MDMQAPTWLTAREAGDRWHTLKLQLAQAREAITELEALEQQALDELQSALLHLGLPLLAAPIDVTTSARLLTAGAADDGLVPCEHGCGQQVRPRGQKIHNRRCPKYTAPEPDMAEAGADTTPNP